MAQISGTLQSRKDFEKTPSGQYKFWSEELQAAGKRIKNWRSQGTKIMTRFVGGSRRGRDAGQSATSQREGMFRLNLFHSNTITLQSMLYGRLPTVDVSRRHDDSEDDVGRVAAEIMNRLLNSDIQENGEEYDSVLKAGLQDRLLPGLGCARVRYEVDTESATQIIKEDAPVGYVHWRNVMWGWARTYSDIPWIAYRFYLEKDEVEKRFGKDAANGVQLQQQAVSDKDDMIEVDQDGPWMKAEIWEIWDKTKKKVVWFSQGYDKVLETKDDFLKLKNFFPSPPFLLANQTTSLYQPVSDFYMAQDLYNEIDTLQTRISIITEAVKVVGVYDKASGDIARMFKEGTDNDLIPVDNWALFAEKGGIQGQVDWVPLQEIVGALEKLRELRDDTIGLLQQVTGMSDIMRGELGGQYEGVGQSKMKAKFGSIRVQALQEEFEVFASDLLQIKAEIIAKHFDAETIAVMANVSGLMEADRELIEPAINLIKNPDLARLKVAIKPDSIAMVDYAMLKQERTEYLQAISVFLQAAGPLIAEDPNTKPFMLQMLQWGLAGFKGAGTIEGVIDKAIEATMADNDKPQKPDPEQQAMQQAMQLEQVKHENNMKEIQTKSQSKIQEMQADMQMDTQTRQAEMMAELQEIAAKMKADIHTELATSQINMEQNNARVIAEIEKKAIETALEIEKAKEITDVNIKEAKAK